MTLHHVSVSYIAFYIESGNIERKILLLFISLKLACVLCVVFNFYLKNFFFFKSHHVCSDLDDFWTVVISCTTFLKSKQASHQTE